MLSAVVIKALLYITAYIPLSVLATISHYISRLLQRGTSRPIRTCQQNIAICYPDKTTVEQHYLSQQSLEHNLMALFELGHIWLRVTSHSFSLIKTIENQALFDQYQDQAVLMLTPHIGAWELIGLYVAAQRQITTLYKPPKLTGLENLIKQGRQRSGANLVPTTPLGLRQLFKVIRAKQLVGILPDQEPRIGSGAFAPFMQQSAYTMTLIHRIIQKTGVKVLLAYAQRLPNGQGFKINFQMPPAAIYATDSYKSLSALNQAIENCLQSCPEQYLWTYKRFKYRPENSPSMYD